MLQWILSWKISLVLVFLLQGVQGEVTLRVLLHPPMVTLECMIINVVTKASTIMMCPNDHMCFQDCTRICSDDCLTNKITCIKSTLGLGMKYTYTFDTTNLKNQGEWTCHSGDQQSSTVIFFNKTNPKSTASPTLGTIATTISKKSLEKKLSSFGPSLKSLIYKNSTKTGRIAIIENYVIILLFVFAVSLSLNIYLISRSILYKISSKKSDVPANLKKKSCFLKLFSKFFCVEEFFKVKDQNESNFCYEENNLFSRQLSSNIYECGPSSLIPPAIILDNYAFIGSPANQRVHAPDIYTRSQSFPSKLMEQNLDGIIGPTKSFRHPRLKSQFPQLISQQEAVSQIIYDDVAEQSISYMPLNYFNQMNGHYRPSQYISLNPTSNNERSHMAMSMNNLAATGFRLPETNLGGKDSVEDNLLKDAINSRVELSKEMINHADTLLKRADTLLNDNDTAKDTTA